MSYTPTLLIKRQDLFLIKGELEDEQWSADYDEEKVAKYLLECIDCFIDFDGVEIIVCEPETTSFNGNVRNRLTDGNVYYKINN